jgi:hypothetical protein
VVDRWPCDASLDVIDERGVLVIECEDVCTLAVGHVGSHSAAGDPRWTDDQAPLGYRAVPPSPVSN